MAGPRAALGLLLLVSAAREGPARGQIVILEIAAGPRPRAAAPSPGISLALNALGDARLAALAGALERLERTLARRRNPLFVPLDDSAERTEVDAALDAAAPALAAAAALAAGRWRSPEGELSIGAVRRCPRGGRCVHLPADPLEPRLRFLAWPLGYGLIVASSDAPGTAARLREGAGPDSRIALVLTGDDLHRLRESALIDRVVRQARRLAAHAGGPLAKTLAALAAAPRAGDEVPWMRLPAGAVLVVPRLGALATADAFLAEVRAAAPGARWLVTDAGAGGPR